jgi:hypothetical protein
MYDWAKKTDQEIADFVVAQAARMEEIWRTRKDLWLLLSKMFMPRRQDLLAYGVGQDRAEEGKRWGTTLYEDTGAFALKIYSLGFPGYMASRTSPWFKAVPPVAGDESSDDVKSALQDVQKQATWALNRSNFYDILTQPVSDVGCFGSGAVVADEDLASDRVVFQPIPAREARVMRDRAGDVLVFMRGPDYKLEALSAFELFGEDCPEEIKNDAIGAEGHPANPFKEHTFVYGIFPNQGRNAGGLDHMDRKWVEFYVWKRRASEGKSPNVLVRKRGRNTQAMVWGPDLESGQHYGSSMASDALSQALWCNKLGEKLLLAAHLQVEPPIKYSGAVRDELPKLRPGGRLRMSGPGDSIDTIIKTLSIPVTDNELQRRLTAIKDWFFVGLWQMLTTRDLPANITAYQIQRMMGEMSLLLSSLVGSSEHHMFTPGIQVVVDYEFSAGRLSIYDLPEELFLRGGPDIQYIGPLAQVQASVYTTQRLVDGVANMGEVAKIFPHSIEGIDDLELMEQVAVASGVPQRVIRPREQVMNERVELAKWNQQNAMADQMAAVGKAMPGLGKAIEPNSALAAAAGSAEAA